MYGIAFSYTGLTAILILVLLDKYPTEYILFFAMSAVFSLVALIALLTRFNEEPW